MRAAALIGALALAGPAHAVDYREVTLTDGRHFIAEINGETEDGLTLTVPPGGLKVSHAQLAHVVPSDPMAYLEQPDWHILVLSGLGQRSVIQTYRDLPGLHVVDPKHPGEFDPDDLRTALACGPDVPCAATVLASAPWLWIVSSTKRGGKIIELHGRLNTEHIGHVAAFKRGDDVQRAEAAALAVGVIPLPAE